MKKINCLLTIIIAACGATCFIEIGNITTLSFVSTFILMELGILVVTLLYGQIIKAKDKHNKVAMLFNYYQKIQDIIFRCSEKNFFLVSSIILILGYFPAYIALYPGTFGYDAPIQIAQYFGDMELSSHHPLAHTYLMGMFFSLGYHLFKSYEVGFAMYIALQGIVVITAVSYSLLFCKRHNASFVWITLSVVYLIINPFTQMLIFNSTKDILFAAFLLLFGTKFAYVVVDERNNMTKLIMFGILICLFRNQGIYIVLATLVAVVILRIKKKFLNVGLIVVIGLSQLFFWTTENLLKIPAGDIREMLCVPMQQVAYVACEFPDTITEEQSRLVEEVLSEEGINSYLSCSADPVKQHFNTPAMLDNFNEHLANYIEIGLSHVSQYMHAWKWLVDSYWNSEINSNKEWTIQYTFKDINRWEIKHVDLFPAYYYRLCTATKAQRLYIWEKPEICLWIILAVIVIAIAKRNKEQFTILLPFGLYFCTALLGPVALVRYLYPVTLATPLLVSMLFLKSKNSS